MKRVDVLPGNEATAGPQQTETRTALSKQQGKVSEVSLGFTRLGTIVSEVGTVETRL